MAEPSARNGRTIRYSNYVEMLVVFAIAVFVLFSVLLLATGGAAAIGFVLLLGFLLLIGVGLSIAWAHRAVTEFSGGPFPGIWGVFGFDIEPDEVDAGPGDASPSTDSLLPPGGPLDRRRSSAPNAIEARRAPTLGTAASAGPRSGNPRRPATRASSSSIG